MPIKKLFHLSCKISLGGLIGFVAWGHLTPFAMFSFLIPILYFTESKTHFFLIIFGYYLAASRGLLIGTIVYYNKFFVGVGIWLGAALVVSLFWVLFWSDKKLFKALFLILTFLIISLPPVGLISWANPLFCAALVFPGMGFMGIFLYLLLILIISLGTPKRILLSCIIIILVIVLNHNLKPPHNDSFEALKTYLGKYPDNDQMAAYKIQNTLLKMANKSKSDHVVLPENALGVWNDTNMMIWDSLKSDKIIFGGATITTDKGNRTDNVLLKINKSGYDIIYKQRVPVLSMWKPWDEEDGTNAYLFHQEPFITYNEKRIGVFICYEQLILFTLLQTMYYEPDYLLAISNLWWAKNTSIKEIEKTKIELIGILFKKPFTFAINE